jgi:hypothetical protein
MSDYKVNLMPDDQPSIAEKEQQVLESVGADTGKASGDYKVDLRQKKQEQDAVQEQTTDESVLRAEQPEVGLQEVGEGDKKPEVASEEKEEQVIELIQEEDEKSLQQTENETTSVKSEEADDVREEKVVLPENVQKLVDFMNETGGTLEDYVRLSADYSNVDENTLLKEYYKQTKSHLDSEEINFLLEDQFAFDEDMDDERDVKRKKLAFKEEVRKAKDFLNTLKDKYYAEVRLGSRLAPEQQKAIDFFNRYNNEQSQVQELQKKQAERFNEQTSKVFNEDFKGFDFSVGENKFRFKVKDVNQTKEVQSDIMKAFGSFLDENNMLKDGPGYHKALFAARNADTIANHFYEQGRADAIKQLNAESKNINMDPRKSSEGVIDTGGVKVRAISGESSSKLRIKIKN